MLRLRENLGLSPVLTNKYDGKPLLKTEKENCYFCRKAMKL